MDADKSNHIQVDCSINVLNCLVTKQFVYIKGLPALVIAVTSSTQLLHPALKLCQTIKFRKGINIRKSYEEGSKISSIIN